MNENEQAEYRIGGMRCMMTQRQAEIWNGVNAKNMEGATINLGGYWLPLWPTVFAENADNALVLRVCDKEATRADESPCG